MACCAARDPLLLGLVGLGAAGLLTLAALDAGARAGAAAPVAEPVARVPESAPELVPALQAGARTLLPALASAPRQGEELPSPRAETPRKEREFVQAFLALEQREPGALEARAQAVLDGTGPAPERVALLRALAESGASCALAWHEYAVRAGPDESGPHAVSVASYALGALTRHAQREPAARQALLRLAFDAPEPSPALRRRAASALAASGDENELELLRRALARETDELLLRGALAELARRDGAGAGARILASFPDFAPSVAAPLED